MREPKDITHDGKTLEEWLEVNKREKANLRRADLSRADLSRADLRGADLSGADGDYALFYGGKHQGWATVSHIGVGCEMLTHEEWRDKYAEIGGANDYTHEEIERYRQWIFSLDWLIEKGKENK